MTIPSTLDTVLAAARAAYTARNPASLDAHRAAREVLPGGNTRTVLYHDPFPLRIVHGEGATIVDADGHRYRNFLGEYTAGLFGHSHPVIRAAIDRALDGGVNLAAHNRFEAELARHVVERFAAIDRVRFTNSGTEANLMAVSTARIVTGRSAVMVFKGGYHGGLLYFVSGGSPVNAPYPFVVAPYNDVDGARDLIRRHAGELACVLVEPMLGSGGCIPASDAFLRMLRDETTAAGCLLVFDEVMTSRFGRGGAHGLLGMRPDLVTLGKWIGGGMSFGAFGGRADLMDRYDPERPDAIPHAGTFNNNVLTMSAGVAAMSQVFTPDVAEALHARGDALRARLNRVFDAAGVRLQATGDGSLMTIHATRRSIRSPVDLADSDDRIKALLFLDLLDEGFMIARRGFIALTLVLADADLDDFVAAVERVVAARRGLWAV